MKKVCKCGVPLMNTCVHIDIGQVARCILYIVRVHEYIYTCVCIFATTSTKKVYLCGVPLKSKCVHIDVVRVARRACVHCACILDYINVYI